MKINKILASTILTALCIFTGCDEEESPLSRMVMVSENTLTFNAEGGTQTVTVYADAEWVCERPDWVTITPETGTGVTDVNITVGSNYLDGSPDEPRSATLVFEGYTVESRASLTVNQNGDRYRNVGTYTVDQIGSLTNGDVLSLPNVTVVSVYSGGFMVSDSNFQSFLYVSGEPSVEIGDEISIYGDKTTDNGLPKVNLDIYDTVSSGISVSFPEPVDITGLVDTYSSTTWDYVFVDGSFEGTSGILSISDALYSINIIENVPDLAGLIGHKASLTGFYAGTAAPYIRMFVNSAEDGGSLFTYWYFDDFEWIEPWCDAVGAIDSVGENTTNTDNVKQLGNTSTTYDGMTAYEALVDRGYDFVATHLGEEVTIYNNCGYLQRNYIKFGKTDYQAGIILAPLEEEVPLGNTVYLQFDWCPMMRATGIMDPTSLVVSVTNGDEVKEFDIPEHGLDPDLMKWITAEVDLTGITLNPDTRIKVVSTQWDVTDMYRWFIDNISIYTPAD